MVPGIDGVGRRPDGTARLLRGRRRRARHDGRQGGRRPTALGRAPDGVDVAKVAAAMNPAMSSWVALRRTGPAPAGPERPRPRRDRQRRRNGGPGRQSVWAPAVWSAPAVTRPARRCSPPGADEVVQLTDDADVTGRHWPPPRPRSTSSSTTCGARPPSGDHGAADRRTDRSRALDWIQIGAVAGPTIELPSVALRSANLRLQGNGQGAVSPRTYLAELPSLVEEITAGTIAVRAKRCPWLRSRPPGQKPNPGERTVLVP